MATKTLETRVQLKYDTLTNWTANDPVLLEGEVAVVSIPAGTENSALTAPAIGLKVGNGTSTFTNLPFTQSIAGDVYMWAKAATKPEYTADEITNLDTYISSKIEDTDTIFRTIADTENPRKIILQSKAKDAAETEWTEVSTFTMPDAVLSITLGETVLTKTNGVITLPAYPTTLPASDVSEWAKAETKPEYDYSEITNTPDLSIYAKKADIASVLNFKGTVTDKAALDALDVSTLSVGDVYHLNDTGAEWAVTAVTETGATWEELGTAIDLSNYATKQYVADEIAKIKTDDITEGSSNLYFTEKRASDNFKTQVSTDLSDGAKIIHTDDILVINCGNSTIE